MQKMATVVAIILLTCACGTTRQEWGYFRAVRDADRLADQYEYEAARERYIELAAEAPADVDLRYLRFRAALMLEKMGRYDEAISAYREIWSNPYSVYDDYPARALNRTARIVEREFGDVSEAESIYWAVIRTYPDSTTADDALFALARLYDGKPRAFIDRIVEIYPELIETEIADNLVWEASLRLDEELDDCPAAMELYDLLITRFQRSGFSDNALWNTGACLRRMGRIDDEYELLRDAVGAREMSILIGDYNYAFYHPAYMRLAEIEEERGDIEAAIAWYDKFQRIFVFALDWDDVQYTVVQHLVALGEYDKAQKRLEELKKEWPESYYIEKIKNLLAFDGGTQ